MNRVAEGHALAADVTHVRLQIQEFKARVDAYTPRAGRRRRPWWQRLGML